MNGAPCASHPAFVWCRHFSRERLRLLSGIRFARRRWLDDETSAQSAFSRLQIGNTKKWYNVYRSIDGVWEGKEVYFEPVIRPLFIRYAVEVFRQALKDTLDRYPNFNRFESDDGPLIGERRISFPDRQDEAATTWLQSRFWQLAEKGNILVGERFSASFVDNAAIVGNRIKVHCEIELDLSLTDESTWHHVKEALSQGKIPEIDPSPRRCDWRLASELLQHLSIPELYALNWEACLPPLVSMDRVLLDAAAKCDLPAIRTALQSGANPNCFDRKHSQTPLGRLVESTSRYSGDDGYSKAEADQKDILALDAIDLLIGAGAAVDLVGYNETTPLADACLNSSGKVIIRLLDHGADPTILCYDDEYEGSWGTAWEYADFRCNPHANNDDSTAWDALCSVWPAPFEGVWIPENPETRDSVRPPQIEA